MQYRLYLNTVNGTLEIIVESENAPEDPGKFGPTEFIAIGEGQYRAKDIIAVIPEGEVKGRNMFYTSGR